MVIFLLSDSDDNHPCILADETHGEIERLDVFCQRADRNPVDAGFGNGADGIQRDIAGSFEHGAVMQVFPAKYPLPLCELAGMRRVD